MAAAMHRVRRAMARGDCARCQGLRKRPEASVEETAPCFIVRDSNGQALAFVYWPVFG